MMYHTLFWEATASMFIKTFYNILFKYFPINKKEISYYYKRFYHIVNLKKNYLIVLSFVFKI